MSNANCNVIFFYWNNGLEIKMMEWYSLSEAGTHYTLRTTLESPGSGSVIFSQTEMFIFDSPYKAVIFAYTRLHESLKWLTEHGYPTEQKQAAEELGSLGEVIQMALKSMPDYDSQRQDKK
jgi:hypothetical protein